MIVNELPKKKRKIFKTGYKYNRVRLEPETPNWPGFFVRQIEQLDEELGLRFDLCRGHAVDPPEVLQRLTNRELAKQRVLLQTHKK